MSMIAAALDRAALVPTPYPHLVVEEALPREIADTLLAEMPPLAVLAQDRPLGSNLPLPLADAAGPGRSAHFGCVEAGDRDRQRRPAGSA